MANPRLFALIPCAGTGSRAGSPLPKQYRTVGGRNLLYYALAAFDACSELAQTLVVLAPNDNHFDPRRFGTLRFAVRRCGGATRQASVLNGLEALAEFGARDSDWVLVHDAARPGVTPALIRALIGAARADAVGGIIALPVADTLKCATVLESEAGADAAAASPRIARTEPREGLWQAQTPQMFRLGMLRDGLIAAHQQGHQVTDEASVLEWLGHRPLLVQGSQRNFKVTYPEDFELAETLFGQKN